MKTGTIKAYSPSVNAGVIEGDDGDTYDFPDTEWTGRTNPAAQDTVEFEGTARKARRVIFKNKKTGD